MTTNEEKQILIKDLSARLPYGVKVSYPKLNLNKNNTFILQGFQTQFYVDIKRDSDEYYGFTAVSIEDIKPYLRPMSSMTEEEAEELDEINICNHTIAFYNRFKEEPHFFVENNVIDVADTLKYIDWLNAHHFDYRGLIDESLALEAPEGMYS